MTEARMKKSVGIPTVLLLICLVSAAQFSQSVSKEFDLLMTAVEQSFYLQHGLDPVAAAQENPLHIAVLLGNAMRQQQQTVQRYPDKKPRYNLLVLEGQQFCMELLRTVGYPVIDKLKLTDELILQFYKASIKGELTEWIGQTFKNETGQSLPLVLNIGPNTARYDPRRVSSVEQEENSIIVRFVKSGSFLTPPPTRPHANPEEAAAWAVAQKFGAAFKNNDLQTQASLSTGKLVDAIRNATTDLEPRKPRYEIKVEDVDVNQDRARAVLGLTSDPSAPSQDKFYLVLQMRKTGKGWRVEKIKPVNEGEDIDDEWQSYR
jgi:hypothetical protein